MTTIRRAVPGDAPDLAQLIDHAGQGLPYFLWERMREEGESVWDVGIRRALRDEGSFSWRNSWVLESEGEVAACLVGYPTPREPEAFDPASVPAMFVPLLELENLARLPGADGAPAATWYINVLASYPRQRGRGFGSRLVEIAQQQADLLGLPGLSLIVSDANDGARRLYARLGFAEHARRAMIHDGWRNPGEEWILMMR